MLHWCARMVHPASAYPRLPAWQATAGRQALMAGLHPELAKGHHERGLEVLTNKLWARDGRFIKPMLRGNISEVRINV